MSNNKTNQKNINFAGSVQYFLNSIEKLMCSLPPVEPPYYLDILWYAGLPFQLIFMILGKLIRFPAEIWEGSKNDNVECSKPLEKKGFLVDIVTFIIESILYLHGGILKIIDIVISSLGFGYGAFEAKELLIPQVTDFEMELTS